MNDRVKLRTVITILFGVLFIVSAGLSVYYLKTDKANEHISWLLTAALFSFLLMVGNAIVLVILRKRSSREAYE